MEKITVSLSKLPPSLIHQICHDMLKNKAKAEKGGAA